MAGNHGGFGQTEQVNGIRHLFGLERGAQWRAAGVFLQQLLSIGKMFQGIGVYDAGALTPALPIATTGGDFSRWWPIRLERIADCQAQVTVE